MQSDIRLMRRLLLDWGRCHFRPFWWRELRDPYAIAVIEVLLRQTKAETIEDHARTFLKKYSIPEALAEAPAEQLENDLKVFGLQQQRAQHLQALGAAIVSGGSLTNDEQQLRSLPGIGLYSASAVRCFAFGEPVPLIDVNVARIVSRVFDIVPHRGELRKSRDIRARASELLEGSRPREINWALLDLGSLICTSRAPSCAECPLRDFCALSRTELEGTPVVNNFGTSRGLVRYSNG